MPPSPRCVHHALCQTPEKLCISQRTWPRAAGLCRRTNRDASSPGRGGAQSEVKGGLPSACGMPTGRGWMARLMSVVSPVPIHPRAHGPGSSGSGAAWGRAPGANAPFWLSAQKERNNDRKSTPHAPSGLMGVCCQERGYDQAFRRLMV